MVPACKMAQGDVCAQAVSAEHGGSASLSPPHSGLQTEKDQLCKPSRHAPFISNRVPWGPSVTQLQTHPFRTTVAKTSSEHWGLIKRHFLIHHKDTGSLNNYIRTPVTTHEHQREHQKVKQLPLDRGLLRVHHNWKGFSHLQHHREH